MSWLEKLQGEFVIKTGDSEEFKPLWKSTGKTIEFNVAEFEFPNLKGTLVKRGTMKGRKFEIEIYFQGENHLDEGQRFENSSNDPRPWVISHPHHGNITVQPTGLSFDYTKENVTKITGAVIETITENNPKVSVSPADKIKEDKEETDSRFANNVFVNAQKIKSASITDQLKVNHKAGLKVVDPNNYNEYFNSFSSANSAITKFTSKPLEAIRLTQSVISSPALFSTSLKNRISLLSDQFKTLSNSVFAIGSSGDKVLYEHSAGVLISTMALASATPIEGDYGNRNSVLKFAEIIIGIHNQYLSDLDSLQSENGSGLESYIPDASSIIALNDLINFTISNLLSIALNAKQERSVILEEDSNIILLAHRFYGLKQDDSTIEEFINNNEIGLNELLLIKKGRKVVYYI